MIYEGSYTKNGKNDKKFRDRSSIPILGFGTGTDFHNRDDDAAKSMILAFDAGYRLFDTAQVCFYDLILSIISNIKDDIEERSISFAIY